MKLIRYLFVLLLSGIFIQFAQAAELRIFASVAIRSAFDELVPQFEKATGQVLVIEWGTGAAIKKMIDAGEAFDVAIAIPSVSDSLVKSGALLPQPRPVVGVTTASLAYREGTPRPEVSSPEALREVLLHATGISLSDPSLGGASSNYFMAVIKELGISDSLESKLRFTKPGEGAVPVGAGTTQYGVALSSEIAGVAGVSGVPIFPSDQRSTTILVASIGTKTDRKDAARAFVEFLTSPQSLTVLKARGFPAR